MTTSQRILQRPGERVRVLPHDSSADTIVLDDTEVSECFVRATGPGAQNVNKGYGRMDRPGAYWPRGHDS